MKTDKWLNNSTFVCKTCMYYMEYRCRRNAPSIKGFPAVYPEQDWCGDHKMSKLAMRSAEVKDKLDEIERVSKSTPKPDTKE